MRKALISGITGQDGSYLAELLLSKGYEVHGLMRRSSTFSTERIDHLYSDPHAGGARLKLHFGDLSDGSSMRHVIHQVRPDEIYNLAAQSHVRVSFDLPEYTADVVASGALRLLEAVRDYRDRTKAEVRVYQAGSSEMFGATPPPHSEVTPFYPRSPYAVSKVGADLMARHYAEAYGMNIQVTRMFTHTGPRRGDVFAESSFAKQIVMHERGMIPALKVGNLQSLRTIADVRDAVRAYFMLLTVNPEPGAVYNIGGNHTCKVHDVLNMLVSLSGGSVGIETDPARLRPIDADLQVPDCSKFKAHTGWEPVIPFEQTMSDLLEYWRGQELTVQR